MYGQWIDLQCFVGRDWDFYHDEARRLTEMARGYAAFMSQTIEDKDKLARLVLPNLPRLSVAKVTHRQFIERLHIMVDVLCQIEALAGCADTGYMLELRQNGDISFIPPSKIKTEKLHERTAAFY